MVRAHIHASGKGRGGGAKTTRRLGDNSSSAVRPSWPEFPTASRATCPAGPDMRGIGHRVRLVRESGSFRGGRRGFGRAVFPASFCILRGCGCPLAGRAARFPGGGYTLLWDVARAAASLCRCVPVSLCRCVAARGGRRLAALGPGGLPSVFPLPSSVFPDFRLPTSSRPTPEIRPAHSPAHPAIATTNVQAKRTKKVGIVGKYGTRYGSSLRKQIKKIEVSQHSKYFCSFCGKYGMKRSAVGIWKCKGCNKSQAGGAYTLNTPASVTVRSTVRRLREQTEK